MRYTINNKAEMLITIPSMINYKALERIKIGAYQWESCNMYEIKAKYDHTYTIIIFIDVVIK